MSTQKRFEIGVDYEGVSERHLQVNEEIVFSNDEVSRIFMPECGSFYVESLEVRDNSTGELLGLGKDFDVFVLDSKATKESGKQACGLIIVTNLNVRGVLINYRFVGGIHSSGFYILEQLLKMYPNGVSSVISFDEILQKPLEFDPAYHTQHVSEFFKTDLLLVWLEKLRQGVNHRQHQSLESMYQQAQASIDALYGKFSDNHSRITTAIANTLNSISVQSDEYILTDSPENPAIKRGYGNWTLITNTILRGGPAGDFLVGSGALIAMGSDQLIRNCYIWYNKKDSTVNEATVKVTSAVDVFEEGDTATFLVETTNIPNGRTLEWFLEGVDDKDIWNNSAGVGAVTIVNGQASINFTVAKDRKTEGNEAFVLRFRDFPNAFKNFMVLDTSVDRRITSVAFLDTSNASVEIVSEDAKFKLRISSTGLVGQTVYLHWSPDAQYLSVPPVASLVITNNVQDIALETIGNLQVNETRVLSVHVLEKADEIIDDTTPTDTVYILDTSQDFLANIVFRDSNGMIISNIDEDKAFNINVRTNGGVGQELKFSYRSNRPLTDFEGLLDTATVDVNKIATIVARNNANYVTATETEFLEVTVTNSAGNKVLATATLLFNDTTKNPNFSVSLSKTNDGSTQVTTVNEGESFYLVFKVPGWPGATTPPVLDINLDFLGSPSLASRVKTPSRLTGIRFSGDNGLSDVEWIGGNTLAIKFTAIADKAIHGNASVDLKWKLTSNISYNSVSRLTIIDTSKPQLSLSWSSSSTEVKTITSVDEMVNGNNNLCYLWINVDGDASTFNNLQLVLDNTSVANINDLVQVYPQNISIASGLNTHVVRVDINSDFIVEGNELLKVNLIADGFLNPIATASLQIVDNSVGVPITFTRSPSTIFADGDYSEWEDITITANVQPLSFATELFLTKTNDVMVDGLEATSVQIPANQSSYTFTVSAKKIRHETGDYSVGLTLVRKYGSAVVSTSPTLTTNFKNDRTPPKGVSFIVYKDAAGVTTTANVEEGKSYWVRLIVDKPLDNMLVVIGNQVAGLDDVGTLAGNKRLNFPNNRKVILKTTETRNTVSTGLIEFSLPLDRQTNPDGLALKLVGKLDWSSNNSSLVVGDSYVDSLELDVSNPTSYIDRPLLNIVDTSKTSTAESFTSKVSGGATVTSFNEGDDIFFNFNLTDTTLGDVYELVLDSATNTVDLSRFSSHEFASKDITIATNDATQNLVFKAKFVENFITDGDKLGAVTLRNKTTGADVIGLTYTLVDTSKAISLPYKWLDASDVEVSSVNEGVSFKLEVTPVNLPQGYQLRLVNPTGRAISAFSVAEVNVLKYQTNGKVVFNFTIPENYAVDFANTFGVTVEVVGRPEKVTTSNLTIIDTSKAPVYAIKVTDANGNPISQTAPGQTYYVELRARGVAVGTSVEFRNEPIVIEQTAVNFLGNVFKTVTFAAVAGSDEVVANTDFTIASFNASPSVKMYEDYVVKAYVNSTVKASTPMRVNNTNTPTYAAYFTSDATGNDKITTANEGDIVYAVIEVDNLAVPVDTTWHVFGSTGGTADGGWTTFDVMSGDVTIDNGKTVVALQIPINYITTGNLNSSVGFLIPDSGEYVLTPNLNIIDTFQTPSFRGLVWSRNVEGTDPVTTLNPGEIIYLVILTKNILPGQQFALSYPVMQNLALANFDYGPHEGSIMTSITQYDASTGEGRMAITFRVSDSYGAVQNPPPPVIPTGPQYDSASTITGLYVNGVKKTTIDRDNVVIAKFDFGYMKPSDVLRWELFFAGNPLPTATFSVKNAAGGVANGSKSVRFDIYTFNGIAEFQANMPSGLGVTHQYGSAKFYLNDVLIHSIDLMFPGTL